MSVNTTIRTIRHGHTLYNEEKRYAGGIDIPLSRKGAADCREVSRRLKDFTFDAVVSSTLRRAIETANLLVPGHPAMIQNALCNERRFGIMEGRTWNEIQNFEPPLLMINVGNDLHTVNPSGGEPFEDVWQRAKKFRNFLFKNYQGRRILIVSHGVFLQMFHGLLKGLNCIESLAAYPSNLELASFYFSGNRLTGMETIKLDQIDTERF
jgi:broad specificity phosphatase PhoE